MEGLNLNHCKHEVSIIELKTVSCGLVSKGYYINLRRLTALNITKFYLKYLDRI